MKPGQDLVVGGFIGLGGTVYAAERKAEFLRGRLSQDLLDAARKLRGELEKKPEEAIFLNEEKGTEKAGGRITMEAVGAGGIFAALWRMAERYQAGLAVYLRKIPVRQETIEICEALELNPYELLSGGCVILAADNGMDVLSVLNKAGIYGAAVGKVTDSNDRLLLNGEVCSHLNRPAPDEIEKLREDLGQEDCFREKQGGPEK